MRVVRGLPATPDVPIALTIGNFDGVHLGHQAMLQRLLRAAREHGLPACVMIFEPQPREFFDPLQAPARITTLREKLELFAQLGIERVFVRRFDRALSIQTAEQFVDDLSQRLRVRWLLVGDDFRFGTARRGDLAMLRAAGARDGYDVASMASVMLGEERVSSTSLRQALGRADFAHAARLLGRPFRISGRVAHGQKLGRALGFPTANILLKRVRVPVTGIFAVKLSGLSHILYGAASLGVRPTVARDLKPVLEVHLLDFYRDIYGERVAVEFCTKLREEEKYPSLDALKAQITLDVAQTRQYFAAAA